MYFTLNYLIKLNKLTLLINIGVIFVLIGSNTFLYYFQIEQEGSIFEEKFVAFNEENIGIAPMTPQYNIILDLSENNTASSNNITGDFTSKLEENIKQAYQEIRGLEVQPQISVAGAITYTMGQTSFIITDQSLKNESDGDFGVPIEYLFFDDDTFEALFKLYNLNITELSDDSFVYIRQGFDIFSSVHSFREEQLYKRDFNPINTSAQGAVTIGYNYGHSEGNFMDENGDVGPYNGTYSLIQNITIDPDYILDLETLFLDITQSDDQIVALQGGKTSPYILQSGNLDPDSFSQSDRLVSGGEEEFRIQKNLMLGRLGNMAKVIPSGLSTQINLQVGISFADIPLDDYKTLREMNPKLWSFNNRQDFEEMLIDLLKNSSSELIPEVAALSFSDSQFQPDSVIITGVEDVTYISEFIYFTNVGVYLVLLTIVALSQVVISRSKLRVLQILKDRGYTKFSLFVRGLVGSAIYTGLGTLITLSLSFGFLFAIFRDYSEIANYVQSSTFSILTPLLAVTVIVQVVIDWNYIRNEDRKTN